MGYKKYTEYYSEETRKKFEEYSAKQHEYGKTHTHETEKKYKVNEFYVYCRTTKYDECLKRKGNEDIYVISVYNKPFEEIKPEELIESCIYHEVFETSNEANEAFKQVVEDLKY